jgi:hypothetical protein
MASACKQAAMGTRMGESTVPTALSEGGVKLSRRITSGLLLPSLEGMSDDANRLGRRGENSRGICKP